MKGDMTVINELLIELFNDILIIEQNEIKAGSFKDISISEVHTMEAIGTSEPRTMGEVAKDLNITVGTLTTAINNLVKKGYVERNRCDDDRRVVRINLTKRGAVVYKLHSRFHSDMIKATVDGFTDEEQKLVIKALGNLRDFFVDHYGIHKKVEKEK